MFREHAAKKRAGRDGFAGPVMRLCMHYFDRGHGDSEGIAWSHNNTDGEFA